MTDRVVVGGLSVAGVLYRFVMEEALPGVGVHLQVFRNGADALVHELAACIRELVARRAGLQTAIDEYHLR